MTAAASASEINRFDSEKEKEVSIQSRLSFESVKRALVRVT